VQQNAFHHWNCFWYLLNRLGGKIWRKLLAQRSELLVPPRAHRQQ
jgi:hypothetical protein